jgi:hypothetical protein
LLCSQEGALWPLPYEIPKLMAPRRCLLRIGVIGLARSASKSHS